MKISLNRITCYWKSSGLNKLCFLATSVFCVVSLLVFTTLIDSNAVFQFENVVMFNEEDVIVNAGIISTKPGVEREEEIVILRYTKYFGHFETTPVLISKECPNFTTSLAANQSVFNIPCRITFDRKYFKNSDALVFHSHDLEREELPSEPRDENQIWVYLQQESPLKTGLNLDLYRNKFNWTMTYRQDSDVFHPYGRIVPRSTQSYSNGSSLFRKRQTNKSGLVAWIVSNCDPPSLRQNLVYQLQKFIPVDIFGSCGRRCPPTPPDCFQFVASNYKFYLSFENSLCSDYITEKFFNALIRGVLPVVFGGGVEGSKDYSSIAPNHSYIDARSFKSPEELATYLIYLNNTPEEYLKYFEWRKYYHVYIPRQGYWCNLCHRLYEHLERVKKGEQKRMWYKDLRKWWNYQGNHVERTSISYHYWIPACAVPPKKMTAFNPGYFRTGWRGKVWRWLFKTD